MRAVPRRRPDPRRRGRSRRALRGGRDPLTAPAVATRALTKQFGRPGHGPLAVAGIDLAVPAGSIYGFLGPNGSGKTTTIRMLLGLVSPTSGHAELLGRRMPGAAAAVLPRVGSLVEGPAFHPYLSGEANLRRLDAADATADPRTTSTRVAAALDRVGLRPAARRRYRAYSLGMRQRLGLAAALLRPRDLLVLDEPTNGLDPAGTREVRHLVTTLGAEGVTVLVSSHLLAEVEQMCTHVGIMAAGSLRWQGPLAELSAAQRPRVTVTTPDTGTGVAVLHRLGVADAAAEGTTVTGTLGDRAAEDVVAALVADGVRVRGFAVGAGRLEDAFVALTGEGFDVSG